MRFALCLLLVLGCVPGRLAFADPPERPALDPRFMVSLTVEPPTRSDECECQDKNEKDGCACENCGCKLVPCSATTIDEKTGDLKTFALKTVAPIQTIAQVPPRPAVEGPPTPSLQNAEALTPNLNEAFRRLRAAGYEWKEVEECELCDTCPSGFKYTGKTFFTATKDYDEGQMVGSSDPTPKAVSNYKASVPAYSSAVYSSAPVSVGYSEPSCGSDYSYSAPVVTYSTPYYGEASCGSDGYSYSSYGGYYSSPAAYSRPRLFQGGFLRGLFQRRSAASYSAPGRMFSRPVTYSRGFGGACLTGNCG